MHEESQLKRRPNHNGQFGHFVWLTVQGNLWFSFDFLDRFYEVCNPRPDFRGFLVPIEAQVEDSGTQNEAFGRRNMAFYMEIQTSGFPILVGSPYFMKENTYLRKTEGFFGGKGGQTCSNGG